MSSQRNQQASRPALLPAEREILMKERATLIDRITFVEQMLDLPSCIMSKAERERVQYEQRMRGHLSKEGQQ